MLSLAAADDVGDDLEVSDDVGCFSFSRLAVNGYLDLIMMIMIMTMMIMIMMILMMMLMKMTAKL